MSFFKGIIRAVMAGIVSIVIISFLLCFYSITPVHIDNPKGNTDYIWPANSIWVKVTEGIAFGRYDADGFNNRTVIENPDIIFLGSSHIEATEVMQDENAPFLLSEKLEGKYSVYNMGISGHHFYRVCQYLPANLELYDEAPKAVIVETDTLNVTKDLVDQIINKSIEHMPSPNNGVVGLLQRIPFFRTAYHQVEEGLLEKFMPPKGDSANNPDNSGIETNSNEEESQAKVDGAAYEELFVYFKELEDQYSTQLIILYQPYEKLNIDGSISYERDKNADVFKSYSEEYGITLVDMTKRFEDMYYKEHHVAHGFCTGELATGHLNRYGHAAMADELYDAILKLEESGEICR